MGHQIGLKPFAPMNPGVVPGRCVGFVDLGTSEDTYKDVTTLRTKCAVAFEAYGTKDIDGKTEPATQVMWKTFTQSLNEKATLRLWLESWRGKKFTAAELTSFDFMNWMDKGCLLNIIHTDYNDSTRAVINNVMAPGAMKIPERKAELLFFSFQDTELDMDVFNKLPPFLQDMITNSEEWKFRQDMPIAHEDDDGDIPF
jgi:hypothetical protein